MSLTFYDGFTDCIVGIAHRYGMPPVVAYDRQRVISALMRDGMTEEEAWEYFDFNVIGGWVGDTTPVFVDVGPIDLDEWGDDD